MLKPLIASAALGALLASGALAQTQADPGTTTDPAAPGAMAPAAPGTMTPADPMVAATGDWVADGNFMPVDVGTLTADQIIGADIRNADGEVMASVDDIVLGADGTAESVAAKFGGFLGFGSNTVLLSLDEVEFFRDEAGTVALRSAVSPDTLEGRPDYVKG